MGHDVCRSLPTHVAQAIAKIDIFKIKLLSKIKGFLDLMQASGPQLSLFFLSIYENPLFLPCRGR